MLKTESTRWALAVIAALGLFAGAAWALEAQTVPVPPGNFEVAAALVPGGPDADVCGTRGEYEDSDIRFSVRFTPAGVLVNGVCYGPFDPFAVHDVVVRGYTIGGQWFCDTTVVDTASGAEIASQCGHAMQSSPDRAHARGQDVLSLTAE